MLDIATTATFDRLFSKLPKSIQRKAASKTDLFKTNPFYPSLHTELRYMGHYHSIYDDDMFK